MFDVVTAYAAKWQLLSRESLFVGLSDVLSAPWFLVLVFLFVARPEFQVAGSNVVFAVLSHLHQKLVVFHRQ